MRRNLYLVAILALLLGLLILAACGTVSETSPAPDVVMLFSTPAGTSDQATLEAWLTQEKSNADAQAAATAEIMRVNAQATLDSANATLSAALTQEQNNANIIAAQIAATAEIVRANAQATLVAANSTQSAALTQDAIRQTQEQFNFEMTVEQQYKNEVAANTQTAVANIIATQTQSAAATSQWYADQSLQRQEQRQGPLAFLWMWCLPIFIVLFAGLCLWGFWRWLKIKQNRQRFAGQPIEKLQERLLPPESDIIDSRYQLTKPDDQVGRWLDEVKHKLLSSDKKDEDDITDN